MTLLSILLLPKPGHAIPKQGLFCKDGGMDRRVNTATPRPCRYAVITSIWDNSWLSRSFVPIVQGAETGERVFTRALIINNNAMNEEKKITMQEKIAVWCLLLIIKIVKPTQYLHEYQNELNEIKEIIKNNTKGVE